MSADAAPTIRPPRIGWKSVLFWTLSALGLAATLYLVFGNLTPRFPSLGVSLGVGLVVFLVLALGSPILSGLLDRLDNLNVVERCRPDAVVWNTSRSARVAMFSDVGFSLFFANLVAGYGWAALRAEDWKRTLAGAFVFALAMYSGGLDFWRAMTGRITLTIDGEGVRGADLPNGGLAWSGIDRVTLKQNHNTRKVGLIVEGRTFWIDLEPFGITARRFLSRLEDVAPQVEIDWPTGQYADLSAD